MCTDKVLLVLLFVCALDIRTQQITPELGQKPSQKMLENWNMDIFPDGRGLPQGQGDAVAGEKIYQQYCLSCHGVEGIGDSAEELAGAEHSLTENPPDKTIGTYWPYATTLFDFIRRSMPLNAPGTLSHNRLYAVTAYLLYLNGIIQQQDVINARTLPKVKMPNSSGFINWYQQ